MWGSPPSREWHRCLPPGTTVGAVQRASSILHAPKGARRVTSRTSRRLSAVLASALIASAALTAIGAGATVGAVASPVTAPLVQGTPKPAEAVPLEVHIESITPSTLTDDDEPLTITGTVTNRSDEAWTTVNLYAFRSVDPIIDASTLAESAALEEDAVVGDRITTPGTEDTVEVLEPGLSEAFVLTVPRSEIAVTAAGVYWLGVHASGESPSVPRDEFADGRARTFIPVVPRARGKDKVSVEAAIVVPIRETVWFDPSGRVGHLARWSRSLADGGRLDMILDASDTAGVPITWLVDPAVLTAVKRLADGNPARSLAPDPAAPPPSEEPSEEPTLEPDEGAGGGSSDGQSAEPDAVSGESPAAPNPFATFADPVPQADPDDELTDRQQALALVAQTWIARFTTITAGQTVLSLPYGDLDVSAAAAHDPAIFERALTRSVQVMAWLGVLSSPALAPRDGILSPAAILAATNLDTTILIGDTSFAVPPDAPSSMVQLLDHKVVVTSTGAAAGGPSPTPANDPLAIRQRLLSEAALRVNSGVPAPLVVMLPADWRPTETTTLLADLGVPWLSPVTVAEIAGRPAVPMLASDLTYTIEDEAAELDATNFTAADQLSARADLLAGVLTLQNLVRQQVADEVLASLSSGHRLHSDAAADSVQAATGFISDQLALVEVDAPDTMTLSSERGPVGLDLINGLDQPVTIRVGARSDASLELDAQEVFRLGPKARKRILPEVSTSRPGIHQVTLMITDVNGEALGGSASLQIRAAQVSGLIWLLLAGGAALLFGTIGIRLVRRLRAHNANASEDSARDASSADTPTAEGPVRRVSGLEAT